MKYEEVKEKTRGNGKERTHLVQDSFFKTSFSSDSINCCDEIGGGFLKLIMSFTVVPTAFGVVLIF